MKDILKEIITNKRDEVASGKQKISLTDIKQHPFFSQQCLPAKAAFLEENSNGIIAEFKRKSPSKGSIHLNADVKTIIASYQQTGVSMCSVLTDNRYFGALKDDLLHARSISEIPLLRKDFIIDKYQIYETKAMGADVILLIASILQPDECKEFTKIAKDVGLEVLLEVHRERELECVSAHVDLIGINNRDLHTFEVKLEHSIRLAELIPPEFIKIAESGISDPRQITLLRKHGFKGFLIGENFMKEKNPGKACEEFIGSLS